MGKKDGTLRKGLEKMTKAMFCRLVLVVFSLR